MALLAIPHHWRVAGSPPTMANLHFRCVGGGSLAGRGARHGVALPLNGSKDRIQNVPAENSLQGSGGIPFSLVLKIGLYSASRCF